MHDILTADLERLETREHDLDGEVQSLTAQLESVTASFQERMNAAFTELVGVRHSKATLHRILGAAADEQTTE
jgi:hypothetical protein